MPWVGRHEVVNHGGDLQAPEDAQDQRYMRDGLNLLHGYGHDAPPVVACARQQQSGRQAQSIAAGAFSAKIAWFNPIP
jgi:hypothetical protein